MLTTLFPSMSPIMVTRNGIVSDWKSEPDTALTVAVYVPSEVVLLVRIVSVVLSCTPLFSDTLVLESFTMTPDPVTEAVRVTVPVNPQMLVVVRVTFREKFCMTEAFF